MASLLFLLISLSTVTPETGAADAGETDGGTAWPVVPVSPALPPESQLAQLTIEQRVIIRVPMMRPPPPDRPPPPPEEWEERKGPKCVPLRLVRAAAITSSRGVDLMLRGRERLRALLGRECSPASLYSGFYIEPNEDGQICAGRDKVLARSGADCPIRKLVRLVPDDD